MTTHALDEFFTFENKFSAITSGESSSFINAIIVWPNTQEICVLDRENAKLKRFSHNGDLIDSLALIDIPHSMCRVDSKIAITKPDKGMLEFVDIKNDKFHVAKYIPTNVKYFGICYLGNDKLAVSSWSHLCVDIIDLDGIILNSTKSFRSPNEVPDVLCCTCSNTLIISEINAHLDCLNISGIEFKHSWRERVEGPIGEVTYDRGGDQLVICLPKSGSILLLSIDRDRKHYLPLGGSVQPLSARIYDNRLYIGDNAGNVQVFREKSMSSVSTPCLVEMAN